MIDPERTIDAAIALRDAGRGDEAVAALRTALAAHPRNPRLWQTLGTVHRALEQSAAAVDAFAAAARLAPNDPKPAHGVAQASLEAGRPAVALFERAHRLAPADGAILLGRAAAQLAEGRGAEAITVLDAVVAANPLWLDGQATLARLRWMMGDADGFTAGYVRAIQGDPRNPALWSALAHLLLDAERYAAALEVAVNARGATGRVDALRLVEASATSELGDLAAADRLFATLSSDAVTLEHRLRHLLRAGRADEAAACAEPMLGDPAAGRLWPFVSVAWRLLGDPRYDWLEGDAALISTVDLDLDLTALAGRLRVLHRAVRDPLGQSVRGGTQTDGPLFAHEAPEIQAVRAAVRSAVERHVAALGRADPTHPTRRHIGKRTRFAGSWSVRLTGAGHHSAHVHPQGWLSSALYVAVPDEAALGEAPAGWLQLGAPPPALRAALPPTREIAPRPGTLVLFPSTMWHGTAPIAGGERLTIAFDVAAIG